jgi:hypothetical protein
MTQRFIDFQAARLSYYKMHLKDGYSSRSGLIIAFLQPLMILLDVLLIPLTFFLRLFILDNLSGTKPNFWARLPLILLLLPFALIGAQAKLFQFQVTRFIRVAMRVKPDAEPNSPSQRLWASYFI